jgi:FAD/FMN-containing dehydrogenase
MKVREPLTHDTVTERRLSRRAFVRDVATGSLIVGFNLGLTVGGTLSIGGIGTTSFRHGAQVDHVFEMQVVTGEGRVVTCSDSRYRDLFEGALAGQGQCAIMTRAVLRLVPASTKVREYVLPYADLPTLLDDGARLAGDGRFDGVVALITASAGQWSYSLAARHFTPPDTPDDAVLTAGCAISGEPSKRRRLATSSTWTRFRRSNSSDPTPISACSPRDRPRRL